jgi:hypothetical protein
MTMTSTHHSPLALLPPDGMDLYPERTKVRTLCGSFILRQANAHSPTCPVCRERLASVDPMRHANQRCPEGHHASGSQFMTCKSCEQFVGDAIAVLNKALDPDRNGLVLEYH